MSLYVVQDITQGLLKHKLKEIIESISSIAIEEDNTSLFSMKYRLSPQDIVYLLLIASKEFNFKIDENFIDELEDWSVNELTNLILKNN